MTSASLSRRAVLLAGLLGPAIAAWPARAQDLVGGIRGALDAGDEGLSPGAPDEQSAALSRALRKAERNGQPLFLPPGRYEIAEVELPEYAHLLGVPGQTSLVFRGGRSMLSVRNAKLIRIEGLTIDGGSLSLGESVRALLDVDGADDLVLSDCAFTSSTAGGVALRACAGRVERSTFRDARTVGLDLDRSRGMIVADNVVADCGDTGILVQRDEKGSDDTIVRGNRVSGIRADSGGTGQYGNGINLDKANGVIVSGNRLDDCGFSAIRCYSSDNVQVAGNIATRSGEVAVYVEFASVGAIVSDNLIDDAAVGISFANFMEHRGRLASCSGNLIRNISGVSRLPRGAPLMGSGISAEADLAISGNVIENAPRGLRLGWGEYLRDIAATGNTIRDCPIGIAVSVVEGAGPALVANNLISDARDGAILGMRWEEVATGDLALEGADGLPQLTIEGNLVS